jgi:hypothetical protein
MIFFPVSDHAYSWHLQGLRESRSDTPEEAALAAELAALPAEEAAAAACTIRHGVN